MKASAVLLTITQVLASLPLEILSVAITVQGEDKYSVVLQVQPSKTLTQTLTVEDLGELTSDNSDGVSLVEDGRIAVVGNLKAVVQTLQDAAAPTLPSEVIAELQDTDGKGVITHKIKAIKLYREMVQCDLRTAKEDIEAYIKHQEAVRYMHLNAGEDQLRIVHVEQHIAQQSLDIPSLALRFADDAEEEGL